MSKGAKLVPWVDWTEWAQLRDHLAHGDHAAAGAMLALYRLRRPSALPLAVQSSVELAALLDFRMPMEAHARRMALAMAVVRLVNGTTDRIQPRADGATARSVHSLARALRLPPILVELRHQASHNALPRLDALVDAGKEAMEWLEAEYWRPQAEAVAKHLQPSTSEHIQMPTSTAFGAEEDGALKMSLENTHGNVNIKNSPETGARTPKRRRVHWRTSGTPEQWQGVPMGMLPGSTCAPKLIGIDVESIIGINWKADEDEIHPETIPGQGENPPIAAHAAPCRLERLPEGAECCPEPSKLSPEGAAGSSRPIAHTPKHSAFDQAQTSSVTGENLLASSVTNEKSCGSDPLAEVEMSLLMSIEAGSAPGLNPLANNISVANSELMNTALPQCSEAATRKESILNEADRSTVEQMMRELLGNSQ